MISKYLYSLKTSIITIINKTLYIIKQHVKDIINNLPACIILFTSTITITNWLTYLPLEIIFLPIPFINELMITSILSIIIVYGLSTIAGNYNNEYKYQTSRIL